MAVPPDLNRGSRRRLLAVVAVVLLAHVAALEGLSRWQAGTRLLKPMVSPLYTRILEPEAPKAPPAVVAQAAPPSPPTATIRPTPSLPAQATRTLPQPKAEEPPPEPQAAAPEPAVPRPEPPAEVASPPEPPAPAVAQAADPPSPGASAPATPGSSAAGTGTDTAAVTPAGSTETWPSDTRLRYRLGGRFRSGELYGDARVLWQREGAKYQVRVEVELTFMAKLVMTSQGEVGPTSLQPQVYEEVRNGRPRGLRVSEREVILGNGKVVPRPPGLQDTASQFVELSHRFASGQERLEVGRAVSFWMARPSQVDLWTYDVVASETLRTKLGDIEAFHLKPRPIANPRGNITAEMWFAPSLQYLPVRIRVNMGEEAHIDLLVESIEQR